MNTDDLRAKVIGCAYRVYNQLGTGFIEKVYENALRMELEKVGLKVAQQKTLNVFYDGEVVGEFYVDLFVNDCLILELKAAQVIAPEHEVQLVNYLTATKLDSGLILNFGPDGVGVKRKFRVYRNPNPPHPEKSC